MLCDEKKFSDLSNKVIGCAIEVHRFLGPGLLESAYQNCLCHELSLKGIPFEKEKPLPVSYKGCDLECGYRIDILIDGKLIIELKSVSEILDVHKAQLLSYMKLLGIQEGLLINFNETLLRKGIKRFVL